MATLVLSTVGTLLGGPVGGAIGSLLGQSIDQQLLGPGPREGPRLGDLSVQTSTYDTPIPRIFGTMRVAGSVIWSTDLQEDSEIQGAKGQPDSVTYSYSASFAVALSSRPIRSIGRIWADGKLIRTAAGEFTVSTGFRFHDGSEDQAVDPLIASIEGLESAPAHRGIAVAVFEHLQLAEFGNRIPFLTFEVEADSGAVPTGLILGDVSEGAIVSGASSAVTGYAAYGATVASAVGPLVEIFGLSFFDDGKVLASPAAEIVSIAEHELGCTSGPDPLPRLQRGQTPMRDLPSALSVSYYDPAREYQSGVARAAADNVAARDETVELPAVLHATAAKALAESSLARRWAEREQVTLRLPPAYLTVRPGALVQLGADGEPWKAERVTVDSMTVVTELRPLYATIASVPADAGRVLSSLGVEPAPTTVKVMELPDDGTDAGDSPIIALAASSTSSLWRPVPIEVDVSGRTYDTQTAAARTVLGSAISTLAPGQTALFDMINSVDVELLHSDQWLESRDDLAVSALSNLAIIGNELIQFGDAVPIGPNRFRLSRLLRGRRGTEWATGLHTSGEQFVLLEPARLKRLPASSVHVGGAVRVRPRGLADSAAGVAELQISGDAMRPPSPVHLRTRLDSNGSLQCDWIRRSRRGWAWLDGVDAPLDCSAERYRLALRGPAASLELETTAARAEVTAADLASLGSGDVEVSVVQIGDLAVSRPASITVTLN